jgi:hypothetical protein
MKTLFLALLMAGPLLTLSGAEPFDRSRYVPAPPQVLLEAMPRVPDTWKLVDSRASQRLGISYQSSATRTYETPPDDSGVRRTVTVVLLDTCGDPNRRAGFSQEGSMMRRDRTFPDFSLTEALLADRFLLTFRYPEACKKEVEECLKNLPVRVLAGVHATKLEKSGPQYEEIEIDELHPERNRRSTVSLSTKDLDESRFDLSN